jgi:hypothetical protein
LGFFRLAGCQAQDLLLIDFLLFEQLRDLPLQRRHTGGPFVGLGAFVAGKVQRLTPFGRLCFEGLLGLDRLHTLRFQRTCPFVGRGEIDRNCCFSLFDSGSDLPPDQQPGKQHTDDEADDGSD